MLSKFYCFTFHLNFENNYGSDFFTWNCSFLSHTVFLCDLPSSKMCWKDKMGLVEGLILIFTGLRLQLEEVKMGLFLEKVPVAGFLQYSHSMYGDLYIVIV